VLAGINETTRRAGRASAMVSPASSTIRMDPGVDAVAPQPWVTEARAIANQVRLRK
jgi:hypothetical protein